MNWDQFKAILWLRWRLSRNQFVRGGRLNAALSIFLLAMMLFAAAGLAAGGVVLGVLIGAKITPHVLLLIWDGIIFVFLVFWLSGLMVEIQRSESVDLAKLLHLPVTLQQVFVFNYAASHFTPSIVLMVPGMIGLCLGMTFGGGLKLALLLPLTLSFVFLTTAWTYCLRGWLAALMVNKRRRRAIIVWVTILFILLAQLPNLVFNSPIFRHRGASRRPTRLQEGHSKRLSHGEELALPQYVVEAHCIVPPGWVGYGAMSLQEGNVWPALGLAAAGFLFGALGLMRSYRMTLRFYQGAGDGVPAASASPRKPPDGVSRRPLLVERRLPWLPDDTAALALATFRSLLRAPELKMALILPVVMGVVASSMWFTRPHHGVNQNISAFITAIIVVFAAFTMAPTMANVFGLDRDAFRTLVLLPTRRHDVLMAKNLAFFPFVAGGTLLLMIVAKFLLSMSWLTFLVGLMQVPTAFLLFSLLGNTLSILVPYRFAPGTLKAKKPRTIVFVAAFGTMLLTPVMLWPILIPPGMQLLFSSLRWLPWLPINLLTALAVLFAVACLYRVVLPLQGRLLQRREQTILREVTEEVE